MSLGLKQRRKTTAREGKTWRVYCSGKTNVLRLDLNESREDKTIFKPETNLQPFYRRQKCVVYTQLQPRASNPVLFIFDTIAQHLESSSAYPGQLHTRQNRRSHDYELVWGYERPEKNSVCTGFSACITGMNRMKVTPFM